MSVTKVVYYQKRKQRDDKPWIDIPKEPKQEPPKPMRYPSPRREPEKVLAHTIMEYLESRGAWAVMTHHVAGTNNPVKKGTPDIVGCYKGRFFAIEVKSRDGELTRAQDRELRKVIKAGGFVCVARKVEDAERLLNAI